MHLTLIVQRLDDAIYDPATNDTYVDAHQRSGVLDEEHVGGVVEASAPEGGATKKTHPVQMLCDAFDAGIEGEGSNPRQAARTLLDAGERAGALLAPDDDWR